MTVEKKENDAVEILFFLVSPRPSLVYYAIAFPVDTS